MNFYETTFDIRIAEVTTREGLILLRSVNTADEPPMGISLTPDGRTIIRVTLPTIEEQHLAIPNGIFIDYEQMMHNHIKRQFVGYPNQTEVIHRLITEEDKNAECLVSFEPIKENDVYRQCSTCKYNYLEEVVKKLLNRKCPHCRNVDTLFKKYINANKKEKKTIINKKSSDLFNKSVKKELKVEDFVKNTRHNKKYYYKR